MRALEKLSSESISKVNSDGPEIAHHSLLIDSNHENLTDNSERVCWFVSCFPTVSTLKSVFVCFDTNEIVAKLYTSLCSFINNLVGINYFISLVIWEL